VLLSATAGRLTMLINKRNINTALRHIFTHGKNEKCVQNFVWETRREDISVGDKITLEWILGKEDGMV